MVHTRDTGEQIMYLTEREAGEYGDEPEAKMKNSNQGLPNKAKAILYHLDQIVSHDDLQGMRSAGLAEEMLTNLFHAMLSLKPQTIQNKVFADKLSGLVTNTENKRLSLETLKAMDTFQKDPKNRKFDEVYGPSETPHEHSAKFAALEKCFRDVFKEGLSIPSKEPGDDVIRGQACTALMASRSGTLENLSSIQFATSNLIKNPPLNAGVFIFRILENTHSVIASSAHNAKGIDSILSNIHYNIRENTIPLHKEEKRQTLNEIVKLWEALALNSDRGFNNSTKPDPEDHPEKYLSKINRALSHSMKGELSRKVCVDSMFEIGEEYPDLIPGINDLLSVNCNERTDSLNTAFARIAGFGSFKPGEDPDVNNAYVQDQIFMLSRIYTGYLVEKARQLSGPTDENQLFTQPQAHQHRCLGPQ